MKVRVLKKAFYGGRIVREGQIIDFNEKKMPSWAEAVAASAKEDAAEAPVKQPETTLHEMAANQKTNVAKPSIPAPERDADRIALEEKAEALGISFNPNIGTAKLEARVAEAEAGADGE